MNYAKPLREILQVAEDIIDALQAGGDESFLLARAFKAKREVWDKLTLDDKRAVVVYAAKLVESLAAAIGEDEQIEKAMEGRRN